MFNFKKKENSKKKSAVTVKVVDPVQAEHSAFSAWLEKQPEDRKKMYMELAMTYGFQTTDNQEQESEKQGAEHE